MSILENRSCYLCGSPDDGRSGLCFECQDHIKHSSLKKGTLCPRCSQPLLSNDPQFCPFCHSVPGVEQLHSISYFNSYMKELLTLFKSGKMPCLRFFFASLIYEYLKKEGLLDAVLVPVPPRRGKFRDQGWDQVDLLCKTLKRSYRIRIERILERTDRIQQKTLSFEEREQHMKKILRYKDSTVKLEGFRAVILFDDIFTSGATISAAAELLGKKYTGELSALVLCSVI
ncbi:ComF family protein [Oceanispirochaeta sp. M1]|nr:ComF family protein [Oceanispirochaeta sp. M1]